MKCNYCGTTIPEGNKICNGCGQKLGMNTSKEPLEESNIIEETEEEVVENKTIKDKNAIDSYAYSLVGFFFPVIGFIFIILAINKAAAIKNPEEKKKAKTLTKIAIVANIITTIISL